MARRTKVTKSERAKVRKALKEAFDAMIAKDEATQIENLRKELKEEKDERFERKL